MIVRGQKKNPNARKEEKSSFIRNKRILVMVGMALLWSST
jgi:hypothetical protein